VRIVICEVSQRDHETTKRIHFAIRLTDGTQILGTQKYRSFKNITFGLVMKILNQHKEQILKLCELNRVSSLFAFGSVTTDKFGPESDIDLVVEIDDIDPISYSDKYFNLKFQLEEILKRNVDLLEGKSIRNRFLKSEIDQTKVQIYAKGNPYLAGGH
jgi:uncharacterized protein